MRVRDRGPDYRNFVQVPLAESQQPPVVTINDNCADISVIPAPKCFVESCSARGRQVKELWRFKRVD